MKFNREQERAISCLDKNLGVIAGAGTGKTAILTERFINIIKKSKKEKSKALESILAITFTEKASQEMSIRIGNRLKNLELESPDYKGINQELSFLNIYTIHGFCARVLRENSLVLGLDSSFKILDQDESEEILSATIREILEEEIEKNSFIEEIMIKKSYANLKPLERELSKAYLKLRNKGYSLEELMDKLPSYEYRKEEFEDFLKKIRSFKDEMLGLKIINGRHGLVSRFKSGLYDNLEQEIDDIQKARILEQLIVDLSRIEKNISQSSSYMEEYLDLKDSLEKLILALEGEYYYLYRETINLINKIDKRFFDKKSSEDSLDYDDLLYLTRDLFKKPDILNSYRQKFDYIMIDEFQDTNALQRDIFFALASQEKMLDKNNIFIVGDPKQSIYGFRGSDLSVFYQALEEIQEAGGEVISLKENYRSSGELISFTNDLFGEIMGDHYDSLASNSSYANKRVGIIEASNHELDQGDLVAGKILELRQGGRAYEDIAVLYRTSTRLGELERALKKYRIPYRNPNSRGFYERREIKDLILFLKFLNLPDDSHSLYGLLKSNFFLIEDQELYKLKECEGENLYEKLKTYRGENMEISWAKNILVDLIGKKDRLDIYSLLDKVLEKTMYLEIMASFGKTGQEIENIRKFQRIVFDYIQEKQSVLNEFLDYLEYEKTREVQEADLNTGGLGVDLTTIHSSKGLEYPVVLIFNPESNLSSDSSLIQINGDAGLALKLDETKLTYEGVSRANKKEEEEELKRVFYVAATRAKEELYFINGNAGESLPEKNTSILGLLGYFNSYDFEVTRLENQGQLDGESILRLSHKQVDFIKKEELSYQRARPQSSFSAYSTFKYCPRAYYYTYFLRLEGHLDLFFGGEEAEIDSSFLEGDIDADDEGRISGLEFGILVHKMIELYNKGYEESQIYNLALDICGLDYHEDLAERAYVFLENYKYNDLGGKKFMEFGFILDLEKGSLRGSIDQISIREGKLYIRDFKTNKLKNKGQLVENYRPQLEVYKMAAEKIFRTCVQEAAIEFLQDASLISIQDDADYRKKLLNDINKFLSFISINDSIEEYSKRDECCYSCKYKKICMG